MIRTGLVSITFRKLSPREIVDLVARAGLEGIEWGGDVHVPHGDVKQAREVAQMTRQAGLRVAAYGSYYKVGHDELVPFKDVLNSAVELGAPVIRVWAGNQGSDKADDAYWDRVICDSRRIADMAAKENIVIAYEFHGGTLTDTNESAQRLLRDVAHENVKTYWQPPVQYSHEQCLEGLEALLPQLTNVHVFTWTAEEGTRVHHPLAYGEENWMIYLKTVAALAGDHYAMLEFVKDGEVENFITDAETLKRWTTT